VNGIQSEVKLRTKHYTKFLIIPMGSSSSPVGGALTTGSSALLTISSGPINSQMQMNEFLELRSGSNNSSLPWGSSDDTGGPTGPFSPSPDFSCRAS
jgi:hypothetical protein